MYKFNNIHPLNLFENTFKNIYIYIFQIRQDKRNKLIVSYSVHIFFSWKVAYKDLEEFGRKILPLSSKENEEGWRRKREGGLERNEVRARKGVERNENGNS